MDKVSEFFGQIFQGAERVISAPGSWIKNWVENMMKTLSFYLVLIAVILLIIIVIYCGMQYYCASTANKCWSIKNAFKFPTVMLTKNGTKNKTKKGTFQGPPTNLPYIIPMFNGDRKN
jgi:hypothetical protein